MKKAIISFEWLKFPIFFSLSLDNSETMHFWDTFKAVFIFGNFSITASDFWKNICVNLRDS